VANEQGISIPTLCHEPDLEAFGSCWVCAVKVEGIAGFVTSCGTKVRDGMSVITDSPEVHLARKTALELLLSDHYADCDAPCKIACPDHVDIQTYVSLIANKQYKEAVEVIKRNLPLPMSVGRICPAFCEKECRRTLVEEPIAIRQLKRCAGDLELETDWHYIHDKKPEKGKKVAVVGAGPAGLTCGYYLSTEGYDVDIFEGEEKAGGWLRYGIPEYRLPKKVLDREIEIMCKNGMRIHYNKRLGKDILLSDLSDKYDAVFVGIGAQLAVPLRIEGSDLQGYFLGVDYLRAVAKGQAPDTGKKVAVVGGGDTAIDCARSALRQGSDVTILYRRTRDEMPAEEYEIEAAEKEGIRFEFLTNPLEALGENGRIRHILIEKMKLGEPDQSGRRRPEPTGETYTEQYDSLIAAVSQKTDVSWHVGETANLKKGLKLTDWNTAGSDIATMHWNGNIFAGGDFRLGPATAIEAVADGKIAAMSIDRFLRGEIMETRPLFNSRKSDKIREMDRSEFSHITQKDRLKANELDVTTRIRSSDEVEKMFPRDKAAEEAERCLECGCRVNTSCLLREYATEYRIDQDNYAGMYTDHPMDSSHPYIVRDPNKCIKCGRCIRACSEIQGPAVLGYIYRGFTTLVGPEFGEKLEATECTSCGKCIEVCPTGALLPKTKEYKLNPDYRETRNTYCTECGAACRITVTYAGSRVLRVDPLKENHYNGDELCYKGRFAWQEDRLQYHADSLKEIGPVPPGTSLLISPKMSDEMIEEALDFARSEGIPAVCTEFAPDVFDGNSERIADMKDIARADMIAIAGPVNQMLKARVRLSQLRRGSKLILLDPPADHFRRFADVICSSADDPAITENKGKIVFIYNRESCPVKIKETIGRVVATLPNARIWVNSDYLNVQAIRKYAIPLKKELHTDTLILFGNMPENVTANTLIRLPLKAFSLSGQIISDCGEKIKL
jgi:formate dehydrogenase major subunit